MTAWTALALQAALAVSTAVFGAGRTLPLAAASGLGALAVPFFAQTDQPLVVFALALYASLTAMRLLDFLRPQGPMSLRHRVWHLHAFFDSRLVEPRPQGLEARLFAGALAWNLAGLLALGLLVWTAPLPRTPALWALRWGCCGFAFLAGMQANSRLFRASYALVGLKAPNMHDDAWASTSLREFWGVRWNQAVGRWLREHIHQPLRSRGRAGLGVALAFLVSAAIHCYLVLPTLGLYWALVMSLFFVLQVALISAERTLRVERWPRPLARAWTYGALLISCPLFTEPMARTLEPLGRLVGAGGP